MYHYSIMIRCIAYAAALKIIPGKGLFRNSVSKLLFHLLKRKYLLYTPT